MIQREKQKRKRKGSQGTCERWGMRSCENEGTKETLPLVMAMAGTHLIQARRVGISQSR